MITTTFNSTEQHSLNAKYDTPTLANLSKTILFLLNLSLFFLFLIWQEVK